jgi:type II secretory pathway predicted ATPase ExeA
VRAALASCGGQDNRHVYVNNPTLTRKEFMEMLALSFQLSAKAATSKTHLLLELEALLTRQTSTVAALIVDEAQSLPDELLEEIRLLANIETTTRKLLPVVLAGQPELATRLNQSSLRQLKQRVALRCVLAPLTLRETVAYVSRRIRIAGGEMASCFTDEAVQAIHARSGGIPRTVSVICDNALITAFASDEKPVSRQTVLDVCRDFDFQPAAESEERRPPAPAEARGRVSIWQSPPPAPEPVAAAVLAAGNAGGGEAAHADNGHGGLFTHFSRTKRFPFF